MQRIDQLRDSVLSILCKLLAAKGETVTSLTRPKTERQAALATGEEASEIAALLARLESALACGEDAAARLKSGRERHLLLERESRAAVAQLDRLISSCG